MIRSVTNAVVTRIMDDWRMCWCDCGEKHVNEKLSILKDKYFTLMLYECMNQRLVGSVSKEWKYANQAIKYAAHQSAEFGCFYRAIMPRIVR